MRVTLEPRAQSDRPRTAPVREEKVIVGGTAATRKVIPYGALMYDTKGDAWTFTNPSPWSSSDSTRRRGHRRRPRDPVSEGPAVGVLVVTVGATELMGAEHKYGH